MQVFGNEVDIEAEIGAIITALAAIVGGFAALFQYYRSERRRRAEFSVSQQRMIRDEETLFFCCRALDWGVGLLPIPTKYEYLFPEGTRSIEHNWDLMEHALEIMLHRDFCDLNLRSQFLLYRNAFDDFFQYLDGLAVYYKFGVIRDRDVLSVIDYYIKLMKCPKYRSTEVFNIFAEAFYPRVLSVWINNTRASKSSGITAAQSDARDNDPKATPDAPPLPDAPPKPDAPPGPDR
jgi:hypothetical protein